MIKIDSERLPILIWAESEDLIGFDEAIAQARNLANHPLAALRVCLMPDYHVGYGMPIGGVLATSGGVVPNAVGVDIGCGMAAVRTNIEAQSLSKDTLRALRLAIHERVPVGFSRHTEGRILQLKLADWAVKLPVVSKLLTTAKEQVGTLGGGNHFIEIQSDVEGFMWFMIHSGSRGVGKQVCDYYDDIAKGGHPSIDKGKGIVLLNNKESKPFKRADDLAYLKEGTEAYHDYMNEMQWCCDFAELSRQRMMDATYEAFEAVTGKEITTTLTVHTHHNYASLERHDDQALLVHRKGAVRAEGLVTIPGSMGTASYIANGLANPTSFRTCSHGAGRVLGRNQAKRTITKEQAEASMSHVVYGIRDGEYDEMPDAYKSIEKVMANQKDLVQPVHRLTPLAVVKG